MSSTRSDSHGVAAQGGAAGAALGRCPFVFTGPAHAQDVPEVARNRTLILRWGGREGRHIDAELWNPYALGANHQNGLGLLYEPLAFYSAFADKTILWLAESYEYNEDFDPTDGSRLRAGITWSDGEAFNADDVAYTLNTARDNAGHGALGRRRRAVRRRGDAPTTRTPSSSSSRCPRRASCLLHDLQVRHRPLHRAASTSIEGQDWTTFTAYDLERAGR